MKRCCFCLDLGSGTIASAVFVLVTRTVAVVLFSSILVLRQRDKHKNLIIDEDISLHYHLREDVPWYYRVHFSSTRLITSIGISCFHLLFSIILLIGVIQRKKSLFLPWIVLMGLEIIVGIGFVITTFVMAGWVHTFPRVAIMLSGISLQCYMLCCVTCYHKQLGARENDTIYNVIPLNSPVVQGQVTNTTSPFYNNAGLYHNTTSFSNLPPKYENIPPVNNAASSFIDKPPSYDEIKRNDDCKGH